MQEPSEPCPTFCEPDSLVRELSEPDLLNREPSDPEPLEWKPKESCLNLMQEPCSFFYADYKNLGNPDACHFSHFFKHTTSLVLGGKRPSPATPANHLHLHLHRHLLSCQVCMLLVCYCIATFVCCKWFCLLKCIGWFFKTCMWHLSNFQDFLKWFCFLNTFLFAKMRWMISKYGFCLHRMFFGPVFCLLKYIE